ncbi:hypothetical protein FRC04_005791 [Tulasnella sp. 424]|nr:hypothetical protein FRC04_005791 [Tulasnella sp. 424]KAG8961975.1 hypothetical protein FRC05_005651 [Tulasnella sp. 425]
MPSEPRTCQLTFKILKPTKRQRWTDALKVPTKFRKVLEHLRHIVTMPSWTPAPFDSLNAKTQDSTEEIPTTNATRIIDCDDDVNILDSTVLQQAGRIVPQLSPRLNSIPKPSTKRKALGQSTSSTATGSSSNSRPMATTTKPRSSQQTSTSSRNASAPAKSTAKGKQSAALTSITEGEDDDVNEQDGNGHAT